MKALKLIVAIGISFLAGAIGSLATIPNIPTWYAQLEKPFFNPPNWVFGPVWTLLYILMGVSLWFIWTTQTKQSKKDAYVMFGIQLTLNALWSLLFFGFHMLWPAFLVIITLLVSIAATMRLFYPISRPAAYLLTPYILWVSFASCLNLMVALLNS